MVVAATMTVPGGAAAAAMLARSGALIDAKGIVKIYPTVSGEPVLALDRVDMSVDDGEFVCLVGPSACGKSPPLPLPAGLDPAPAGTSSLPASPTPSPPHDV